MPDEAERIEREIEEQYKADVEKIRKEIVGTIDATLKEKAHENLLLASIHTWFDLFFGGLAKTEKHVASITHGKYTRDHTELSNIQRTILDMIKNRRIVPILYEDLKEEYKGFRFEMLCGNYEGALRSLRWMLETSIYAVEFQMDKDRADIFGSLVSDPPVSLKGAVEPDEHLVRTFEQFEERMTVFEKYRQPKLDEILSKILILTNIKDWRKTDPSIDRGELRNKIRNLYSFLSKYVHYSKETTLQSPRHRVAFLEEEFFVGRYNKMAFNETYTISMQVLDSIMLLLALLDAWYFGYRSFHEYVKALSHEFRMLLRFIETNEKLEPSYDFLPMTKQVIQKALNLA